MAKKKVSFKVSTEEELEAAANTAAPKPVEEPVAVAETETKKVKAIASTAKPELKEVKAEKPKGKPEPKKKEPEVRMSVNIDEFEGITAGSKRTFSPQRKPRRMSRERKTQAERLAERKTMKLTIGGQEHDLSSASKYMLDMLISSEEQE